MESSSTWYIRTEYEKQPTSGLRRRLEAALGYGFYAIDKEHTKLRLRAGVSIRERKFTDVTKTADSAGEAGLHFEQDIDEWGKLVSDLTYQPSFKDFNDYRLLHESALDIPLLLSKPISLRLGVSNEYNNRVPEDTKRLDTTYFAKLVYKWK